jgi:RNA polymerase sigma factor (sigma-70 family)
MTTAILEERAALPAFEEFYRAQWHAAIRLATCVSGSAAAGEDIAQEVFQRMYRSWGTADEPAAYLRVAIVNSCRSYHRKRRTETDRLPILARRDGDVAGAPSVSGELDDIVTALPERQRTVVRLRYWAGLSEAEIAEVLGCKPGTVKSLASRAKDRLAAALS